MSSKKSHAFLLSSNDATPSTVKREVWLFPSVRLNPNAKLLSYAPIVFFGAHGSVAALQAALTNWAVKEQAATAAKAIMNFNFI